MRDALAQWTKAPRDVAGVNKLEGTIDVILFLATGNGHQNEPTDLPAFMCPLVTQE